MNKLIIPSKTERLIQKNDFFLTRSHDFVEIGGVKWATCNIGAKCPTDIGLYFQWGDTKGYTAEQAIKGEHQFTLEGYKFAANTNIINDVTKYNLTDNKMALEPSDDAAKANWGGAWRMPTIKDFENLKNATDFEWIRNHKESGINGMLFIDKKDSSKKLFFPACGFLRDKYRLGLDNDATYWSSSMTTDHWSVFTCILRAKTSYFSGVDSRFHGFQIRPILG